MCIRDRDMAPVLDRRRRSPIEDLQQRLDEPGGEPGEQPSDARSGAYRVKAKLRLIATKPKRSSGPDGNYDNGLVTEEPRHRRRNRQFGSPSHGSTRY